MPDLKKTIESVVKDGLRTGCGTCVGLCPRHSVDFKQLNQEIFGKEPEDILLGNYLNCYIGQSPITTLDTTLPPAAW